MQVLSQILLKIGLGVVAYKYIILFFGAIIEGPVLMVASGFLVHLGLLDFWPAYLILLTGDLIADFFWYSLGYFGAKKFIWKYGHIISLDRERVEKLEKKFHTHKNKILFISKMTMGFGFALVTLISAGIARVPIKNYAIFNLLGGFVWTGLLMGIGYAFGGAYNYVNVGLHIMFMFAAVVIVSLLLFGFGRFMRYEFFRNGQA